MSPEAGGVGSTAAIVGGLLAVVALALAGACGPGESDDPMEADAPEEAGRVEAGGQRADRAGRAGLEPVQTEMRNVALRVAPRITLQVRSLRGETLPVQDGATVVLDDKHSYVIHVRAAETFVSHAVMTRLMNDYVFSGEDAPLRDLEMTQEEDPDERDRVEITGKLAGLGVPFEIEGVPVATPDGKIRIRAESVQALEIPVEGFLDLLGTDAGGILGDLGERGVTFDGNDVILDPQLALPPPRIRGDVTSVRVSAEGMTIVFGDVEGGVPTIEETAFENFLFYRHGVVRIGKMTMVRTDLRLVDDDPADPFDFSVDEMSRQLVAAIIRLQPDDGLVVHTPDLADLQR